MSTETNTAKVRTDALTPGMRVRLGMIGDVAWPLLPRIIRTVDRVEPAGWRKDARSVHYREGQTAEWSAANGSTANHLWHVLTEEI
jgi:hypothetical protein